MLQTLDSNRKYKTAEVAEILQMNQLMVNYYARKFGYVWKRLWSASEIRKMAKTYQLGPSELWSDSSSKAQQQQQQPPQPAADELDVLMDSLRGDYSTEQAQKDLDALDALFSPMRSSESNAEAKDNAEAKSKTKAKSSKTAANSTRDTFAVGDRVFVHGYGSGTVTGASRRKFVVQFEESKVAKAFYVSCGLSKTVLRIGQTYSCTEKGLVPYSAPSAAPRQAPVAKQHTAPAVIMYHPIMLQPGALVLVRHSPDVCWELDIFARIDEGQAICIGCTVPAGIATLLPYKGNEHLLGARG